MFADPEVMAKWTEYQELQQQFKETHKATDKLKGTSLQPTELKREVTQLEEEKGQLNTKINKLNLKLKKLLDENQFRELYNVTSRLRKEQEEEAKLADRYQEQSIQFKQAEARYYQSQKKLRDVEMSASDGSSGEDILRRLEEDVGMTREHVEVKLPADIVAKQQRLEHVKRLYDMPEVGLDALRNEESEIDRLRQMEQQLLEKQKAQIPTGDDKLSMFRQLAQLVANKKEKAQDRHEMLSEDLKGLEEDLAEKRAKLGHSNMPRILKGAEFQAYAGKLKEKAKTYKDLKGRLSSVIAEKGILSRTEDILKNKHGDHSEFLAKLEKQKGISGAAELQDKVEEISEKTSEVNKQKEMSLEEISRTVEKINQNIKDKKGKLAPLIKELRQVRTDFSQLESEYNEKKSLYESTAAGYCLLPARARVRACVHACIPQSSRLRHITASVSSLHLRQARGLD
jgi:intraflagellar transport protein 81